MEHNRVRTVVSRILLMGLPFAFYIFFWAYDGVVICADSETYIDMAYSREPLYPMFLALCRTIFGTQAYLKVAVLIQSVLAAEATLCITIYLKEKFDLSTFWTYAVMAMPMATSLLCRFAAGRASMYSNSVLTEGITISLYLFFIRYVLEYLEKGDRRSLFILSTIAILGISTRKQMYVMLIMIVVGIIYRCIFECKYAGSAYIHTAKVPNAEHGVKVDRKRCIFRCIYTLVVTVFAVTAISTLVDCTYNYVLRGQFGRHTEDNRFITTVAMYTAERDYVEYIEPEYRDVFLQIYDECEKEGYLLNSEPEGWYDAATHFADHYDLIQLDTMENMLQQYVENGQWDDDMPVLDRMDVIRKSFNKSLIPHEIGDCIHVFINNFFVGLVTTVATRTPILCVYTVAVYLIYVVLLIMCIVGIKDRNRKYKVTLVSAVTLISICINVGLVSAVIFAQTRYTIYNMPLFYIAMIIMISELINLRRGNDE
ncbi:MAG: hypothetical protein KBT19_08235 [Lachnospiraceae bacterium]|nr:hypothetical protein [Candidatus Colinaster equi]